MEVVRYVSSWLARGKRQAASGPTASRKRLADVDNGLRSPSGVASRQENDGPSAKRARQEFDSDALPRPRRLSFSFDAQALEGSGGHGREAFRRSPLERGQNVLRRVLMLGFLPVRKAKRGRDDMANNDLNKGPSHPAGTHADTARLPWHFGSPLPGSPSAPGLARDNNYHTGRDGRADDPTHPGEAHHQPIHGNDIDEEQHTARVKRARVLSDPGTPAPPPRRSSVLPVMAVEVKRTSIFSPAIKVKGFGYRGDEADEEGSTGHGRGRTRRLTVTRRRLPDVARRRGMLPSGWQLPSLRGVLLGGNHAVVMAEADLPEFQADETKEGVPPHDAQHAAASAAPLATLTPAAPSASSSLLGAWSAGAPGAATSLPSFGVPVMVAGTNEPAPPHKKQGGRAASSDADDNPLAAALREAQEMKRKMGGADDAPKPVGSAATGEAPPGSSGPASGSGSAPADASTPAVVAGASTASGVASSPFFFGSTISAPVSSVVGGGSVAGLFNAGDKASGSLAPGQGLASSAAGASSQVSASQGTLGLSVQSSGEAAAASAAPMASGSSSSAWAPSIGASAPGVTGFMFGASSAVPGTGSVPATTASASAGAASLGASSSSTSALPASASSGPDGAPAPAGGAAPPTATRGLQRTVSLVSLAQEGATAGDSGFSFPGSTASGSTAPSASMSLFAGVTSASTAVAFGSGTSAGSALGGGHFGAVQTAGSGPASIGTTPFQFGAAPVATTGGASSFTFGALPASSAQATSSFTFGAQQPAASAPAPATPFQFGAAAPTPTAQSTFTFGAPVAAQPGFGAGPPSFGASSVAGTPGFGFPAAASAHSAAPSFTFGAAPLSATPPGFGAPTPAPSAAAGGMFTFGAAAPIGGQAQATAPPGLPYAGAGQAAAAGQFTFGAAPVTFAAGAAGPQGRRQIKARRPGARK